MGSAGIGKPVLASGAALSFKKSAYQELGGYKEHLHIDSGDDIFLLQDMLRAGKEVRAIPDPALLVRTSYPASGREWVSQRLRWASKAKGYRDRGALLSFGTLIAANGLLVLSTFLFPLYSLFFPVLLISWGVKGGVDRIFLILPQRKFGKGFSWKYFPLALLLYPFQIGSLFLIRVSWRLEWKGRKISDH